MFTSQKVFYYRTVCIFVLRLMGKKVDMHNSKIIRNVGKSLIWEYFFFNNDLGSVDEIL